MSRAPVCKSGALRAARRERVNARAASKPDAASLSRDPLERRD